MSRITFAVAVPVSLAVIVALLFGYAIGMGFQGEGCRIERADGGVWYAVKDVLIGQTVFGGLLALCVAVLVNVLRRRFQSIGLSQGIVRWIVVCASVAFAGVTIMAVISLGLCSRGGSLDAIAKVSRFIAGASTLAALVLTVWAFVRGLVAEPKSRD